MSELANKYFETALGAIKRRDYDHAAAMLVEAIKLKPDFYEAWVVRGNCLSASERPFDALLNFERALAINDKLHDAHNNMGIAFCDIGMFDAAERRFRRSAELLPAMEPHMGLANMYCTLNRLDEAAREYRAAIAHDPSFAESHFNLGITLLGTAQWEEGFKEYEWRWGNTAYPPRAFRNYPKWKGEDLDGKRIVLYPEQGYGDEIMAMRFALAVSQRYEDAAIVLQARTPMKRLARQSILALPPTTPIMVTSIHDEAPITIDYSCPLLDVPMVLGMRSDTVPRDKRYLHADHKQVALWREVLPKTGLNVGLCWWSGGHMGTSRAAQQAKSVHPALLKSLAMPGVNLVSLQKPATDTVPPFKIDLEPIETCHDLADTAALIESLDLVISVDTAVAHLAGALGKPVFNFVRFSGYWPWLSADAAPSPDHSIWYPSMKLLRQSRLGDWSEPIRRATRWLEHFTGPDTGPPHSAPPITWDRHEDRAHK